MRLQAAWLRSHLLSFTEIVIPGERNRGPQRARFRALG